MARKPIKKTAKPRERAQSSRKKASPLRSSEHILLAKLALGVLALAVIAVAALVVVVPKANPPVPSVVDILITQAPAEPSKVSESASPVLPPRFQPEIATVPVPPLIPLWQKNAVQMGTPTSQPMIAIVIDDMGLDRVRSRQTVELPGPLTFAYLAYAGDLATQTRSAREAGHELLVHVPMEPKSGTTDPGPNALLTGLETAELERRIAWNLSQFDGYIGINNHMGSKVTSDRSSMQALMEELAQRELLFLDSRTSAETVAFAEASKAGIPALRRDVFIDHDPSPVAVRASLLEVENLARRQGYAIAIGHPKDSTISALSEWLPDVLSRGFSIVPVSVIALKLLPR